MGEDGAQPGAGSGVGSVAEETARLLDALLGDGSGVPTTGSRREDSTPEPDVCPTCGHTRSASHPSAAEVCHLCPVCQLLRVVRTVRPETLERLADLAGAVTETLRDAAATRRRQAGAGGAGVSRPTVEDIDVVDEPGEEAR